MSQEFENAFEEELEVAVEETEAEVEPEEGFEPVPEVELEGDVVVETAAIPTSFGTVTDRLSEIAEVMEDTTMPLDDALDLLEEAVALGMQASNLLESDMNERDAQDEEEEAALDAEDAAIEAAFGTGPVAEEAQDETQATEGDEL